MEERMCSTPDISVIMGVCRNNMPNDHLEDSIRSVLEQTISPIEFLICDDGSDAAVHERLDALAASDTRVRLVREGITSSLAHKLNLCLANATGSWIARQDDDDISQPCRFQKELEFLQNHPEVSYVGCNADVFDEEGRYGETNFPADPQIRDFLFRQPYLHPTLIFRRSCLEHVNGYLDAPYTELCEDYDLFLRLVKAGFMGANLPEKLYQYRVNRDAKGRKMRYRLNECRTRFLRFGELKLLPWALPYVVKPFAVGLLPKGWLKRIRIKQYQSHGHRSI